MDKIELNDITLAQDTPDNFEFADEFKAGQFAPGRKITMHFELSLKDGEIIDSNFNKHPVEFVVGDGNLLPGFEQLLFGKREGNEELITVPANQAFGLHSEENVLKFPSNQFPDDLKLEKGLMINFVDSAKNEQTGVIMDFNDNSVSVDFNHPLAGRDIMFKVKILSVSDDKSL